MTVPVAHKQPPDCLAEKDEFEITKEMMAHKSVTGKNVHTHLPSWTLSELGAGANPARTRHRQVASQIGEDFCPIRFVSLTSY